MKFFIIFAIIQFVISYSDFDTVKLPIEIDLKFNIAGNILGLPLSLGYTLNRYVGMISLCSNDLWISQYNGYDISPIPHHYMPTVQTYYGDCELHYDDNNFATGFYTTDRLFISSTVKISEFKFCLANKTRYNANIFTDGVIGFGRDMRDINKTLLGQLKYKEKKISKLVFSIKINKEAYKPKLYIGEVHSDFNKEHNTGYCNLDKDYHKHYNWTCNMKYIVIGDTTTKEEFNQHKIKVNKVAMFDTAERMIILPMRYKPYFIKELTNINCSLNNEGDYICTDIFSFPKISFVIGDYLYEISNDYIFSDLTFAFSQHPQYLFNIDFKDEENKIVLGLPFLSLFHTLFDIDNNIIKFYSEDKIIHPITGIDEGQSSIKCLLICNQVILITNCILVLLFKVYK